MNNIDVKVDKNKLTLVIDLTKSGKASGSGKSILIASTGGNAKVEGFEGVQFGLNVYRKNEAASDGASNGKGK